jgi:hypothetical protein
MVKNTGGNKAKAQGRKFVNVPKQGKALRVSTDPNEIYSQVTKNCGNGMCHVIGIDNKTRLCHIRGKFRGRGKKDNFLGNGSWLLVGLRDYESGGDNKKLENCDLLEVYNDFDKDRLKTTVNIDWSVFIQNDDTKSFTSKEVSAASEGYEFSDKIMEYNELVSNITGKTQTINISSADADEEINIDDI